MSDYPKSEGANGPYFQTDSTAGMLEKQAREKTWAECSDLQKLDRLRAEVQRMSRLLEELNRGVHILSEMHSSYGEVLIEARAPMGGMEAGGAYRDRLA